MLVKNGTIKEDEHANPKSRPPQLCGTTPHVDDDWPGLESKTMKGYLLSSQWIGRTEPAERIHFHFRREDVDDWAPWNPLITSSMTTRDQQK